MKNDIMDNEALIRKTLRHKFEIVSEIGKGGMATVYKAIQLNLGRTVALKVIHQNLVHNEEFILRFQREAEVLASLRHPNIVSVYDFDSVDYIHYIAMEYLEGMNLRELKSKNGTFTVSETINYIAPIADALSYMDKRGIVHRDVKPSNIFITNEGRPVLMDFGVVSSKQLLSFSGGKITVGTPEYMSPEQAEGKLKLDGRSDIFSLGVVTYECLTGQVPFSGDNPISILFQVIHKNVTAAVEINSKVPEWLSAIVEKCMEKDRELRFQNGDSLLNAFMRGENANRENRESEFRKSRSEAGKRNSKSEKNNAYDKDDYDRQKWKNTDSGNIVNKKTQAEISFEIEYRKKIFVVVVLITAILMLICIIIILIGRPENQIQIP